MEDKNICQYLEWDSEFFGKKIARLDGNQLTSDILCQALRWCREKNIDCLYILPDVNDIRSIRLAEENQFQLVDIRVTLKNWLNEYSPALRDRNAPFLVRPAQIEDIPCLRLIAGKNHADSRFYQDPHFPKALCDALYETWIDKSCRGYADFVFVAEHKEKVGAYISCHFKGEGRGEIGLFGVAEESRGLGIGQALVDHSLHFFQMKGVRHVTVVTQGRNFKVQRLYQRCGFVTDSLHLWYHKWFKWS